MTDLDRRIAEEIMGESEPPAPDEGSVNFPVIPPSLPILSEGGNWSVVTIYEEGDIPRWEPLPFSSDWNYCMKAIRAAQLDMWMDFFVYADPEIEGTPFLVYEARFEVGENNPLAGCKAEANTLDDFPRAICAMLLEAEEIYRREIKPNIDKRKREQDIEE